MKYEINYDARLYRVQISAKISGHMTLVTLPSFVNFKGHDRIVPGHSYFKEVFPSFDQSVINNVDDILLISRSRYVNANNLDTKTRETYRLQLFPSAYSSLFC